MATQPGSDPRSARSSTDEGEVVDHVPPDRVAEAVDRLGREVDGDVEVSVGDSPGDRSDALRADQQREYDQAIPGASVGVIAGSQAKGALMWGAIGAVSGAVIGALIGLVPFADLAVGARVGLLAVIGAMAGSAAGAVYGGGRQPEVDGDLRDTSGDVTVRARTTTAEGRAEAQGALREVHDEVAQDRVDRNVEGNPVQRGS
jgi:hypothetical protein